MLEPPPYLAVLPPCRAPPLLDFLARAHFVGLELLNTAGSEFLKSCAPDPGECLHTRKVYVEMVEFVTMEVAEIFTPRVRKTKDKAQSDPKKNVRNLLERVEKVCRESVWPENCCSRKCWEKFGAKAVKYRRMHLAAMSYAKRNKDHSAAAQACRVESGVDRDDYEWSAQGEVVCRNFFLHFHNIGSSSTLQKLCNDTKSRSGLIGLQNVHGNWRRQRPGKGRQDCAAWLQDLFSTVAQPRPNSSVCREGETRAREFLPSAIFRTFQSVFDYYVGKQEGNPVSFVTFRRAWLQHHFQVTQSVSTKSLLLSGLAFSCCTTSKLSLVSLFFSSGPAQPQSCLGVLGGLAKGSTLLPRLHRSVATHKLWIFVVPQALVLFLLRCGLTATSPSPNVQLAHVLSADGT